MSASLPFSDDEMPPELLALIDAAAKTMPVHIARDRAASGLPIPSPAEADHIGRMAVGIAKFTAVWSLMKFRDWPMHTLQEVYGWLAKNEAAARAFGKS